MKKIKKRNNPAKLHQKVAMIKIKPQDIAFDIDGVVADTMSSFIQIAKDHFGINSIRKEDITSYWLEECLDIPETVIKEIINKILEDPFGTKLKPIEGAVDTIKAICQNCPVYFVTARPVKEPITEWLYTILEDVPQERIRVVATGQHAMKPRVLKEIGKTYFLEDHLETCQAIHLAGLRPIVFDQPWNRDDTPFLRIHNWNQLKRLLETDG